MSGVIGILVKVLGPALVALIEYLLGKSKHGSTVGLAINLAKAGMSKLKGESK